VRIIAIVMVALGALGLGFQTFFSGPAEANSDRARNTVRDPLQTLWVPPVVSGIVVVSGLIVLASNGRREEP